MFVVAVVSLAVTLTGCKRHRKTEAERHGAALYTQMCAVCHGASGEGYKADQAPAISHPAFLASVTDDFLRLAIVHGRVGSTMSAWSRQRGGPLTDSDVDALVAFIRTWERGPKPALDQRPTVGDMTEGTRVYARECARCHGARGTSGPNVSIGNIELLQSATNGFLRYAIEFGRAGTAMPAFAEKLGPKGIEDVLARVRSFQIPPPPTPAPLSPFKVPPPPPPIPLGPVPLNPKGPEPVGFTAWPGTTKADVIKAELDRHARMALLDARAPSDYINEHIPGAVSVPFYAPEPYFASLPKNAWLVCYCACPHAESGQLAQKLLAHGFTKVTVLDEGLGVWRGKKYGTTTGRDP